MSNSFETKAAALKFLQNIDWLSESANVKNQFYHNKVYYCSHGEYASPNYSVQRYADGWAIRVERFFMAGTHGAARSGRIDDEEFLAMNYDPIDEAYDN